MLYDAVMGAFGRDVIQPKRRTREELEVPKAFDAIRGSHILLVEDNEINQQVASELLESEGMVVHIVDNGKKAVDYMADPETAKGINIILMDLQMPIMGGYEATEMIRTMVSSDELPIIAMTADAMTGVKENVKKVGMNGYVSKPISPAELFDALLQWIRPGSVHRHAGKIGTTARKLQDEESNQEIILPGSEGWAKQYHLCKTNSEIDFKCISFDEGIARVNNNQKLYFTLLKKFRGNNQDILVDIEKHLEQGDLHTAERLAHTLKGVAGNLGASELFKKSKVLDEILVEKKYNKGECAVAMAAVKKELSRVISAIENIMEVNQPVQNQQTLDIDRAIVSLEILQKQLEDYDSDALQNFEKLKQALGEQAAAFNMEQLEKLIEQYDFEGALDLLKIIGIKIIK